MNEVLEKSPWPEEGIRPESNPAEYHWGYLVIYRDGHTEFLKDEKPSEEEIQDRWGSYFRN